MTKTTEIKVPFDADRHDMLMLIRAMHDLSHYYRNHNLTDAAKNAVALWQRLHDHYFTTMRDAEIEQLLRKLKEKNQGEPT